MLSMQIIEAVLFGLVLVIDSFTISTSFGLIEQKETLWKNMNLIGIYCALGQILFLIFGWTVGKLISTIVLGFSKWIGFFLLCSLAIYMFWDSFRYKGRESTSPKGLEFNLKILLLLIISTSFDVISVGIACGVIQKNIMLLIFFTFIFTYISVHGGGFLGLRLGEKLGGSVGQIIGAILIFFLACFLLI